MKTSELLKHETVLFLNANPDNPTARTMVLRDTGLMPPPGLGTLDAVTKWLDEQPAPAPAAAVARRPDFNFNLTVDCTGFEIGRADYRIPVTGRTTVIVDDDMITEAIEGEDLVTWNELLSFLHGRIQEEAHNTVEYAWRDGYGAELNDPEMEEYQDTQADFPLTELRRAVQTRVRELFPEWAADADDEA